MVIVEYLHLYTGDEFDTTLKLELISGNSLHIWYIKEHKSSQHVDIHRNQQIHIEPKHILPSKQSLF